MDNRKCGNCFFHDKFGYDYVCEHPKNEDNETKIVIKLEDDACRSHEYD